MLRPLVFFGLLALLGAGGVFAWRAFDFNMGTVRDQVVTHLKSVQSWSSQTISASFTARPTATAQQTDLTDDLITLKRSIDWLNATQEQMARTIEGLRAAQQEIERKISSGGAHPLWSSDPATLKFSSGSVQPRTTARPTGSGQRVQPQQQERSAPTSLVPPSASSVQ